VRLNGRTIECPTAAETFATAVAEIGAKRVMDLGLRLCGIPLVSRERTGEYQSQHEVDGYFICTHSNTDDKRRLLDEIASGLEIPMTVEAVGR
jgi:hypothetical protein